MNRYRLRNQPSNLAAYWGDTGPEDVISLAITVAGMEHAVKFSVTINMSEWEITGGEDTGTVGHWANDRPPQMTVVIHRPGTVPLGVDITYDKHLIWDGTEFTVLDRSEFMRTYEEVKN